MFSQNNKMELIRRATINKNTRRMGRCTNYQPILVPLSFIIDIGGI